MQRTALSKKLINQLFLFATLKLTTFGERGINFAKLCYRIAPLVFSHTSPVGPLQRTALSKKLINQLFFCLQPSNSQLLVGGGLTSLCSAAASHRSFFPTACRGGPYKEQTKQKVDKSTIFVFIALCLQVNLRHRLQKQKVSNFRHLFASFVLCGEKGIRRSSL